MKLRKVNAVVSLITTILLFGHAISIGILLLSKGRIAMVSSTMAWALTILAAVHAVVSIFIMRSSHKGSSQKNKGKFYPKLNASTIVQRISGAMLIIFTALHILGATGVTQTPQVVHAIVPPLFFLLVMAHAAVSASKAFITLGIGDAKFVSQADAVIKGICAVTLIADVVGFYLFVC